MNDKFDLDFCFKGSRKYVQGPDIFDAVINFISNEFDVIKGVKYSAHEILHNNATVYITKKIIKEDYEVINSLISFVGDDVKYYAVVCDNNNKIKRSVKYSEEIITEMSNVCGNVISFKNILPDSYTEIVVSMNKYFLNKIVKEKGKWIVTRFDYFYLDDTLSIKNKEIKVQLLTNFNNKLTKSVLFLDEKEVGYLYFSLIKEGS